VICLIARPHGSVSCPSRQDLSDVGDLLPSRARRGSAAIAGELSSSVRPEGEPWRPLKLRLEVDAEICSSHGACPGSSPGTWSSPPGAIRSRVSGRPCPGPRPRLRLLDDFRTRHHERLHPAGTLPPCNSATRAASRRSEMRPLVQRPDEHHVHRVPAIGSRLHAHVVVGFLDVGRSVGLRRLSVAGQWLR
jgi:hypothetical protein